MRGALIVALCAAGCLPEDPVPAPGGEIIEDTDADTDIVSVRPPGPNPEEYQFVTAWEILEETRATSVGDACDETLDSWEQLSTPPEYREGAFNYAFFRVNAAGTEAANQSCAGSYPDGCEPTGLTYLIDGHFLRAEQVEEAPIVVEGIDDCNAVLTNYIQIQDRGDFGTLTQTPTLTYTDACPDEAAENDGCAIQYTFDLVWTDAR
jgi:hypothetical protein